MLVHWIVNWLLSALALWLVAQIIPGMQIRSYGTALLATVVIGLVDLITRTDPPLHRFPDHLSDAGPVPPGDQRLLLKLASLFTPGFRIDGFLAALLGSLVLSIVTTVLQRVAWATL